MSEFEEALARVSKLSPKRLALLALELQERLDERERADRAPIAIIGMACRFPGGVRDPEGFWTLLRDGRDAIVEVPASRWNIDDYYDPDLASPLSMNTRRGGFIDDVDQFDHRFFGLSYREACAMDPQHRLLLEVAWEALEYAGVSAERLAGSNTGVYVGCASVDYYNLMQGPPTRGGSGVAISILANRLSHFFDLRGPSMAVDTACSSSLVAADLACRALRQGVIDMALVGGVNLILWPMTTISASQAGMMAPDGRCKTFDARANGYVRSEGCGLVVLKRMADALADGDNVLAAIRGLAVNQDGRTGAITAPNGLSQQRVIHQTLAAAGLAPDAISYIEAHGTGTALGDSIEVEALSEVFGGRESDLACALGSVKTCIGHTEAAAGLAGLIKLVQALRHREIPPVVHLEQQNPHISLEGTPFYIPTKVQPWPAGEGPRAAGLSSFGVGGTNAHLVVEEVAEVPPGPPPSRTCRLLPLSARSPDELRALAARHLGHLDAHPALAIADFCQVLGAGRAHFAHRLAAAVSSVAEVRAVLSAAASADGTDEARAMARGVAAQDPPAVAFLFTGQGAQYTGMGRALYEAEPVFRKALDACDAGLRAHLDVPLLAALFPDEDTRELLDQTTYTQPALFSLGYALAALWRSWGLEPAMVMGHSVGEYTAACVAGVLSLEDGLSLVAARGRLMDQLAQPGSMALVAASAAEVADAIGARADRVSIAALNGPRSVVIAGGAPEVAAVLAALEDEYVFTTPLNVTHGFHSPLMDPVLAPFGELAARVTYQAPRVPLLSNVTGTWMQDAPDADYWCRHIRAPVRFSDQVDGLRAAGCSALLELGPHDTLIKMARRCLREGEDAGAPALLSSLAPDDTTGSTMVASASELYVRGARLDWAGMDAEQRCRRQILPSYPFARRRCWLEDHELRPFPKESDLT